MYVEEDEGICSNSINGTRVYPTFMPEESSYRPSPQKSEKSIIFPQKLDLSTLIHHSKPKRAPFSKKKISPIKKCGETGLNRSIDSTGKSFDIDKKRCERMDLDDFQKTFDAIAQDIMATSFRKGSGSSVTSDRASSVSSSSSGQSLGQKSIFMQVSRAKQLINNRNEARATERVDARKQKTTTTDDVFSISDSNFHLTSEEEDETRPPSSTSLTSVSVELPRRAQSGRASNLVSYHEMREKSPSKHHRNAGTMSNTIRLSDSELADIYRKRAPATSSSAPKCTRRHYSDEDVTLTDHSPVDPNKSIVDEVFSDFRSSLTKETPILRTFGKDCSGGSLGSNRIERARDVGHRSVSLNNIMSSTMGARRNNRETFDGIAPGTLRHSVSTVQVSPQKLRELQKNPSTYPVIPSLARFVIKPSTRDIFPLPLDIDAISGKGLRRDEKSTQKMFGGTAIASQIHGDRPTPRQVTIPQKSAGAARPTTASTAKKVNYRAPPLTKTSNLAPHRQVAPPASYCSATLSDGNAYSISTVTQQLLGTVKSLHPDWLQMIRRLLNDAKCEDVAAEFRDVMLQEKENLEQKYRKNENEEPFEEHLSARITVIQRVLDRMEELGNGRKMSRIQQIKMIHSALLST